MPMDERRQRENRFVSILIANKFNNLNLHVCHHHSIGITTSMCVRSSLCLYRSACVAFCIYASYLQINAWNCNSRGRWERVAIWKKCVCTIVNIVNLLTEYVTCTVHKHKYMQSANAQQTTCHFRIACLKLLHIRYAEYSWQLRVMSIWSDQSQFAVLFAAFFTQFHMEHFDSSLDLSLSFLLPSNPSPSFMCVSICLSFSHHKKLFFQILND